MFVSLLKSFSCYRIDSYSDKPDRIWFAQMLRGIAVLLVVYFHLVELFWKDNAYMMKFVFVHPLAPVRKHLHLVLTGWLGHNYMELGDIGVGLFFLISGFVIPFSLAKTSTLVFFIRRIVRIYPVYILGLSFVTLSIEFAAYTSQILFPINIPQYLSNAFLVHDFFHYDSIDRVNWTLLIELHFYVLCMLLKQLDFGKHFVLILAGAIFCLLSYFSPKSVADYSTLATILINNIPYLIFMIIGICFYNYFIKQWTFNTTAITCLTLYLLFYIASSKFQSHHWQMRVDRSYTVSLLIFTIFYLFQNHLSPSVFFNFLAEISFPLYLVHELPAFFLMTMIYKVTSSEFLAISLALFVVVIVAHFIHIYVELPSLRIGAVLSKNLEQMSHKYLKGINVTSRAALL